MVELVDSHLIVPKTMKPSSFPKSISNGHTAPTGRRTPRIGGTFGYTPSGVHTALRRNLWFHTALPGVQHTAASPPPTKPLGILPIISIVKNYKSLFILLFVITFFIFGVVLTNQIPKINQKCAETAR